ncbi:transcription factor TCP12-like [Salvia hispanica]|uniref:transcription factor TCP12-like n=1 Tax=Salvia hispanica TaxID=49212 RepID=UPI0020093541|nr:transcription factor TCP12-like [Salvia hispanica]
MFPSTNCNNPFDESLLTIRPSSSPPSPFTSSSHQNPTPKHDDNNDLLFNFPSPFLDEQESPLNQIFLRPLVHHNLVKSKIEDQIPATAAAPAPRRRAGKKDRHSKICTAQGIRDRRMRLSLQAARKFFDLQDMLGYDKASKTIEWLFAQSSEAIKELAHVKSESFLSECEDLSGIEEISSCAVIPDKASSSAKALREKARARARRRTQEKMLVKRLRVAGDCFTPNPSIPIDEIRVSEELGMVENFWGNLSSDYQCAVSDPSLVGFLGNWDVFSVGNQVSFAGNLDSVFSEFH